MPDDKPLTLAQNALGRGLALVTLALLALGVVLVQSALASVNEPGAWYARVDVRHTIFAGAALLVLLAVCHFDYRRLARGSNAMPRLAIVIFCITMVAGLLVFVPGLGKQMGTYYRWVRLGPPQYNLQFQPSELIKYALVILLAALFTMRPQRCRQGRWLLGAAVLIGVAMGLVITQDMGTAIIIGAAALMTLLLAGVPWYYLAALLPPAAVGFWYYVTHLATKMARIAAWLDPWSKDNPSSHQVRESLLAITSGGWFGKGPGNSVQKLGYLPERTTDYIFAIFCEEWGFMGSLLLFVLLAAWAWYVRSIAVKANNRFGSVLAAALGFAIILQALMHAAVNLNVLPPTGIGLPFVSYGGTQLLILAVMGGLVISVSARRHMTPQEGMAEIRDDAEVAVEPAAPLDQAVPADEPPAAAAPGDPDASAPPVTVDDLDAFLESQDRADHQPPHTDEPLFAQLQQEPPAPINDVTDEPADR
ncbi:MAG: FtsW/RodA/SpoVE family cell cycle protein [Planctomycetaceae bacterium]|nr:FtsW/RodA/SpoVE family cell cycle protein [Planctomycetaceae bacterium]